MSGSVNRICHACGQSFEKRQRDSADQWSKRRYCSPTCSNSSKEVIPLHIRFWKYVKKSTGNKCWAWTGATDQHGYGKIGVGRRIPKQDLKAHRLSYEMRFGPIQNGNVICHACDNPNCVNPNHLFEGTQKDNMQDASRKGRLNPKSMENLRPGKKGIVGAGPLSNKEIKTNA
ncbi:MAG: hypothetical protein COB78_09905 [Hyphomicrobiales bacterium]|nr:MAG: hypothetical protein COB78_09905 [Hyphomicrobiales bacterium]